LNTKGKRAVQVRRLIEGAPTSRIIALGFNDRHYTTTPLPGPGDHDVIVILVAILQVGHEGARAVGLLKTATSRFVALGSQ